MDALLRAWERRWRGEDPQQGPRYLRLLERSAAPEAELLQVRVAVGRLAPERLLLAAYVGYAAAREALGAPVRPAEAEVEDVEAWTLGLVRWGKEPLALAAAAAAEASLPVCESHRPGDARPRAVVEAARRFLSRPEDAAQTALQQAVWDATFTGPFMPVAYNLGACAVATARREVPAEDGAAWAAEAVGAAEHLSGAAALEAVRAAIARWALDERAEAAA